MKYILMLLLISCGNIRDFKVGDCLLMDNGEFSKPITIKIVNVGKSRYQYRFFQSDINSPLYQELNYDSKKFIEFIYNKIDCAY